MSELPAFIARFVVIVLTLTAGLLLLLELLQQGSCPH
jgi:hypothetical protein